MIKHSFSTKIDGNHQWIQAFILYIQQRKTSMYFISQSTRGHFLCFILKYCPGLDWTVEREVLNCLPYSLLCVCLCVCLCIHAVCVKLSKSYTRNSFCSLTYSVQYIPHWAFYQLILGTPPFTLKGYKLFKILFCQPIDMQLTWFPLSPVTVVLLIWPHISPPVQVLVYKILRKSRCKSKPSSPRSRSATRENVLNCHWTHLLF